jgi:hypothetical protein
MTNLHDFTPGAELREGWERELEHRFGAQRKSLDELRTALSLQRDRATDFIADTRSLKMVPISDDQGKHFPAVSEVKRNEPRTPSVAIVPDDPDEWYEMIGPVAVNSHSHGQIASHLGIPKLYYQKMLEEQPDLLCLNVNAWLQQAATRRLLRALSSPDVTGVRFGSSHLRAYLSNRYRRLDNLELLNRAVLPVLDEGVAADHSWSVQQCGLTDLKMHIECICPTFSDDVRVGDPVALGVKITGSEVGAGAIDMSFGLYRFACSNLMIVSDYSMRKIHIGREQDEFVQALMSDETMALEDEVLWRKLRDSFAGMLDAEMFTKLLASTQEAANVRLPDPVGASQLLTKNLTLNEDESHAIQAELMVSGDPTIYGLTNAITATARRLDFERKNELERAAGKLISSDSEWKQYVGAEQAA